MALNGLTCADVPLRSYSFSPLGNPRWGYAWGVHKLPHA